MKSKKGQSDWVPEILIGLIIIVAFFLFYSFVIKDRDKEEWIIEQKTWENESIIKEVCYHFNSSTKEDYCEDRELIKKTPTLIRIYPVQLESCDDFIVSGSELSCDAENVLIIDKPIDEWLDDNCECEISFDSLCNLEGDSCYARHSDEISDSLDLEKFCKDLESFCYMRSLNSVQDNLTHGEGLSEIMSCKEYTCFNKYHVRKE